MSYKARPWVRLRKERKKKVMIGKEKKSKWREREKDQGKNSKKIKYYE